MFKIIIADDHPLLLEGLVAQLDSLGYENLFKANDGKEAYKLIKEHKPLIAILDIEMPYMDGLSIAKKCKEEGCITRFVILSYHQEPEFLLKAKKINIAGYILKEDAVSEIDNCLKAIINGEEYYSKVFDSDLLNDAENSLTNVEQLTRSELKILRLVALDLSSKEIADRLFISNRTVEKHRSNIINKLELKDKSTSLYQWVTENKHLFNNFL